MTELLAQFPRQGRIDWIGVRPERRAPMVVVESTQITETGLQGDRRTKPGKRAVTLIQAEHLPAIAAMLERNEIDPGQLRRNIVVSGINLLALKDRKFLIGDAILTGTGICAPCSRMEEEFGPGGYNAVRGHGGITAQVLSPGSIKLGNHISAILN
jgi:MOSC domain-containing protein YiiM